MQIAIITNVPIILTLTTRSVIRGPLIDLTITKNMQIAIKTKAQTNKIL